LGIEESVTVGRVLELSLIGRFALVFFPLRDGRCTNSLRHITLASHCPALPSCPINRTPSALGHLGLLGWLLNCRPGVWGHA
jgi:hypothetical protein